MTDSNEPIKILAPPDAVERISRRLFLGGAAGAAVGGLSAAQRLWGDDTDTDTSAQRRPARSRTPSTCSPGVSTTAPR